MKNSSQTPLNKPKPKKKKKKETFSQVQEELEKAKSDFLYLKAEFENYKKQTLKERSDLIRYGGENFIQTLINDIVDDWDRAFDNYSQEKSLENFKKGMDLIYSKLKKTLDQFGIKALEAKGLPFDPKYHEALSKQKSAEVPSGHIIAVFKKAYTLYDKLLRPAQVIVSEDPSPETSNESS